MATGKYQVPLMSRGFQSFLWTQFLGAFNDNLYKIVVSMVAVSGAAGAEGGSRMLSLIGAVFILPFFLFSGYAGILADRFDKRRVLILTKSFEIIAMGLGFLAFISGRMEWMIGVLFLMALQSTFFSPAKYGIVPEMVSDEGLSRANGLLEMSTFLAIILGTSVGSFLFSIWKDQLGLLSSMMIVVAIAGTLTSWGIHKVPPSGAQTSFGLNPWSEIVKGIARIYPDKPLWLTVLGTCYFWFLGALIQMVILLLGNEVMHLEDIQIGFLGTFLAVGIGAGSLAAGRLSGDKVELGLVPLGSIGMGVFALLIPASTSSYIQTGIVLMLLGGAGGLFIVPLNALIQQKSGDQEKGRLIATTNFLNTIAILLSSGVLWGFREGLQISADRIIFILGLFTFLVTGYILTVVPDFLIRFSLWMLTHTIYRIRITGQQHIPFRGAALFVCNHISFVDALLVGACVQRFIRFMVYGAYYERPLLKGLFRRMRAIPVSTRTRREMIQSLEQAREELLSGHVVCIFAEGAISRTGNLLPFKRGFEKIIAGLDVPVIPVHLDRLWGSMFSFKQGRFFWKWPEQLPYPVTVSFGKPLPSTTTVQEVRQAILELGSAAVDYRREKQDLLHLRFIEVAKKRWFALAMADSTATLTYGKTLIASLALSHRIRRACPQEEMIGVLLPASVAGALANIAILFAGKTPVNLNFTAGPDAIASAIRQCGIQTLLSSRLFLTKAKLEHLTHMEGMVYLEDFKKQIRSLEKIGTALKAFCVPTRLLMKGYQYQKTPNDLATVIFSSGSTASPKGIMLSHHNILSNIEGFAQVFWVDRSDRMMGVLPFFHAFGFTGTLWFPVIAGMSAVYHANPIDAKTIGEMIAHYKATILISTPTFYSTYIRKCSAEEFASLRFAIVGAEKLREPVAQAFKEKYGLDLLEGYGCTEMAPVVAVNVPNVDPENQVGHKPGTVGHPIPGVVAKVVDRETYQPLPYGQEGMLLVGGASRMVGYLGQPEKTAAVVREGWYVTGDIALMDDGGFIRITDRAARFSKIGGEMIPHGAIEEAASPLLGDAACTVTAVPDEQRGERLVLFYTQKEMTPRALWEHLSQTNLPKLWIPKLENIHFIEAIPTLGTGKLDLVKVKALARERSVNQSDAPDPLKQG